MFYVATFGDTCRDDMAEIDVFCVVSFAAKISFQPPKETLTLTI